MAYRTQQYVATNRAFGPYLPPYPLQGVGGYRSMRGLGADCSSQQSQLNAANAMVATANSTLSTINSRMASASAEEIPNILSDQTTALSMLGQATQAVSDAQAALDACNAQPTPTPTPYCEPGSNCVYPAPPGGCPNDAMWNAANNTCEKAPDMGCGNGEVWSITSQKCLPCPAGTTFNAQYRICDMNGPTPTPPAPGPGPTPTPTPVVPPKPAVAQTNWLLIGGVVAAVGVVGYLAFTQGGGKKGGYPVASNPRRRSRRY